MEVYDRPFVELAGKSLASSSTLPRASRTADSAVRKSLALSARRRMLSVFDCRARTWRSRSSARETSAASWAFASLAGRWLPLCRRTAASETSYNDATERFDAPPARAQSMASRERCSQMVQLQGIVHALLLCPLCLQERARENVLPRFGGTAVSYV